MMRDVTLALLILGSLAAAQPANEPAKYARMPWHLIDVWWDLGQEQPFESLAVDVTISDPVPASVNLYIAPIGLGRLNKTQFYGGIQTRADGNTKADPKLRIIGPGFLFSMWGERRLEAIRPADGGLLQSSGHEGDFVSARRPYDWKPGKYTYRLTRMDQDTVDGQPCTWVGAFVVAEATNENWFVGALRFPGEKLMLSPTVANFVEIYGQQRPVEEIPKLTVTFSPPIVNGRPATVVKAEAIYPKGVPDYANAVEKDGSLVITVGQPVEDRKRRQVTLLPK